MESQKNIQEKLGIMEYKKIAVPPTMRSLYWKYFGFPADSLNRIISRDKTICTLCKRMIAYNKNTTNLRTHLVARHPEMLIKLHDELKHLRSPKCIQKQPRKKRNKISINKELKEDEIKVSCNDAAPIIEPLQIDDDSQTTNENKSEKCENEEFIDEIYTVTVDGNVDECTPNIINKNKEYTDENLIVEMIIKDLHSTNVIEERGFVEFVNALNPDYTISSKNDVEETIQKMYNEKFAKFHDLIKIRSQQLPYSLSIEIWKNNQEQTLLSVYFNYFNVHEQESSAFPFLNVFFKTIIFHNGIDFLKLFDGINLKNCSAAVINQENDVINEFLFQYKIPTVMCFETIINTCIEKVLKLPEVENILFRIQEIIDLNSELAEFDFCEVSKENLWSKLNMLNDLCNNTVSSSDEINDLIKKIPQIKDTIQPLKVTLETLVDEPIAFNSLVKPLSSKLIDEHFCPFSGDNDMIIEIKNLITQELTKNIDSNNFFMESAFFDPRFQSFLDASRVQKIIRRLVEKFRENKIKGEKQEISVNRRSNLQQFFKQYKLSPSSVRNSLDSELIKYTKETYADLDQCPMEWWNEVGYIYRHLKKISEKYLCVPCCINNIFRYSTQDQIHILSRRKELKRKFINQLWFLHYNKELVF